MATTDPYTILNLRKGSTDGEIKQAYYEMVKKWDPENHADRFMVIQQAYDKLRDPKKRAKTDLFEYNWVRGEFSYTPEERQGPQAKELQQRLDQAREAIRQGGDTNGARRTAAALLLSSSFQNFRRKQWREAIHDLEQLLELDPTNQRAKGNLNLALMRMGWSYATNNLIKEAVAEWEKSLTMNPDNLPIIHNLAIAAEADGQRGKAERYWGETQRRWRLQLDDDPENEYVRCLLIEMHRHFGGRQLSSHEETEEKQESTKREAIEEYREVLKMDPDDFEAQLKIAETLMEQKRFGDAVRDLRRLTQKHPNNVQVLDIHAWALLNSGQIDQAFISWQRAHKLHPNNQTIRDSMIKARLELGKKCRETAQYTPALVHFKALLNLVGPKSPEAHKELARTFESKGDRASAYRHYMITAKLNPKDKDVRRAISDLKMRGSG